MPQLVDFAFYGPVSTRNDTPRRSSLYLALYFVLCFLCGCPTSFAQLVAQLGCNHDDDCAVTQECDLMTRRCSALDPPADGGMQDGGGAGDAGTQRSRRGSQ